MVETWGRARGDELWSTLSVHDCWLESLLRWAYNHGGVALLVFVDRNANALLLLIRNEVLSYVVRDQTMVRRTHIPTSFLFLKCKPPLVHFLLGINAYTVPNGS